MIGKTAKFENGNGWYVMTITRENAKGTIVYGKIIAQSGYAPIPRFEVAGVVEQIVEVY